MCMEGEDSPQPQTWRMCTCSHTSGCAAAGTTLLGHTQQTSHAHEWAPSQVALARMLNSTGSDETLCAHSKG